MEEDIKCREDQKTSGIADLISKKSIIEAGEMDRRKQAEEIDKGKRQEKINDSKTLFTDETIKAAIESQRLRNQQRLNQVAQTKFGNSGQQEQEEPDFDR